MTQECSLTRDAATKAATLRVAAPGPWKAYAGKTESSVNFAVPVASGTGPGDFPLPGGEWEVFAVEQAGTVQRVAERLLPMAGGHNFRDLGGMPAHGGKRTVWGKLFRTDDLQNLTPRDLAYLASIPVATIVDFRTPGERAKAPDAVPAGVKNVLHYPITPGNLHPNEEGAPQHGDMDKFMRAIYRALVGDPAIAATYRAFFARIGNDGDLPLIFHCAAGKDRTGFAAALILLALGVDRETVFADYEFSNACLSSKYASLIAKAPEFGGLYIVKRAYLEEALHLVEREHGSVERYLTTILGVNIPRLRESFLA